MPVNWANQSVWTGDNLPIMRGMNSACIDLIYLDPPFNSKTNYAAPIGSKAAGAEFKDTWTLTDIDVQWINLIEAKHPALYRILLASITNSDKAYLAYMAARLLEMQRILKPTGSIYLHCDPTMSHYLKLVMDAVFGRSNFLNEIIWHYGKYTNAARHYQKNHDVLLAYCKEKGEHCFNRQFLSGAKSTKKDYERGFRRHKPQGNPQLLVYDKEKAKSAIKKAKADGLNIVYRMGETKVALSDVWQIPIIGSTAKERLGYPTQKPLSLLRRIILASSNEGDVVLDPFCGCATACIAAEMEHRQWVGIDISPKAAELVQLRMRDEVGLFFKGAVREDIPKRTDIGRLKRYNHPDNKKYLYGEQGGDCAGCNTHFEVRHLEIDHIIAREKGGTDHLENLQLLCGSCNRIKGERGMDYLKAKLQLR